MLEGVFSCILVLKRVFNVAALLDIYSLPFMAIIKSCRNALKVVFFKKVAKAA